MKLNAKILTLNIIVGAALILAGALTGRTATAADAKLGQPAPNIATSDIYGEPFRLKDHRGNIVVLEWTNYGCPYVRKHYDSKNMQTLQKKMTENDVTWVSVVSSAPGKQGYMTAAQAVDRMDMEGAAFTTQILDDSGEIGMAYGAKTTPHMFVIDPDGILVYNGAIDNKADANPDSVKTAINYVVQAVTALQDGRAVKPAQTKPYGCSVKY